MRELCQAERPASTAGEEPSKARRFCADRLLTLTLTGATVFVDFYNLLGKMRAELHSKLCWKQVKLCRPAATALGMDRKARPGTR